MVNLERDKTTEAKIFQRFENKIDLPRSESKQALSVAGQPLRTAGGNDDNVNKMRMNEEIEDTDNKVNEKDRKDKDGVLKSPAQLSCTF